MIASNIKLTKSSFLTSSFNVEKIIFITLSSFFQSLLDKSSILTFKNPNIKEASLFL